MVVFTRGIVCNDAFFNATCIRSVRVHDTRRSRFGRTSVARFGVMLEKNTNRNVLLLGLKTPSHRTRCCSPVMVPRKIAICSLSPPVWFLSCRPPPPTRTPPTFSREYKHLGCFKDKGDDRILGTRMYDSENQSTDVRSNASHHFVHALGVVSLSRCQVPEQCMYGTQRQRPRGVATPASRLAVFALNAFKTATCRLYAAYPALPLSLHVAVRFAS